MTIRRVLSSLVPAVAIAVAMPAAASAQSGKWTATINTLTIKGAADLTVEPRNDKQSRAKISFRNTSKDKQLAWDIAEGRCGQDGLSIAPLAAFRQVRSTLDGGGDATANVPLLKSGKEYYVRVFDPDKQPRDSESYGCANLSEKS